MIEEAIAKANHKGKVFVGLDCAASEFYNESDKTYDLNFKAEKNDASGKKTGYVCNTIVNLNISSLLFEKLNGQLNFGIIKSSRIEYL